MGEVLTGNFGGGTYSLTASASGNLANSGGGGGNGVDLEHRVYTTERDVAEIKADIASIKATLPHLATKAWVTSASGLLALVVLAAGAVNYFKPG